MVSCGTELSATTFGTLMIAGANAQNYPLVKLVSDVHCQHDTTVLLQLFMPFLQSLT